MYANFEVTTEVSILLGYVGTSVLHQCNVVHEEWNPLFNCSLFNDSH